MLEHPLGWVHGDVEINATAHVIRRNISCVQYEGGVLLHTLVGVPARADGPPIVVARHNDHYKAVEAAPRGMARRGW
jgi:hypothetical protein